MEDIVGSSVDIVGSSVDVVGSSVGHMLDGGDGDGNGFYDDDGDNDGEKPRRSLGAVVQASAGGELEGGSSDEMSGDYGEGNEEGADGDYDEEYDAEGALDGGPTEGADASKQGKIRQLCKGSVLLVAEDQWFVGDSLSRPNAFVVSDLEMIYYFASPLGGEDKNEWMDMIAQVLGTMREEADKRVAWQRTNGSGVADLAGHLRQMSTGRDEFTFGSTEIATMKVLPMHTRC
jgi:hypothetical protein